MAMVREGAAQDLSRHPSPRWPTGATGAALWPRPSFPKERLSSWIRPAGITLVRFLHFWDHALVKNPARTVMIFLRPEIVERAGSG